MASWNFNFIFLLLKKLVTLLGSYEISRSKPDKGLLGNNCTQKTLKSIPGFHKLYTKFSPKKSIETIVYCRLKQTF